MNKEKIVEVLFPTIQDNLTELEIPEEIRHLDNLIIRKGEFDDKYIFIAGIERGDMEYLMFWESNGTPPIIDEVWHNIDWDLLFKRAKTILIEENTLKYESRKLDTEFILQNMEQITEEYLHGVRYNPFLV